MSGSAAEFGQRCRTEIVDLHHFFVAWLGGALDNSAVEFSRFTAATHPNFTMVVPSGQLLDKAGVSEGLRGAHGSRARRDFQIEIRNVNELVMTGSAGLLTYEEWQFEQGATRSARTSTVLFVPAGHAANGVAWRHLHETLMPT